MLKNLEEVFQFIQSQNVNYSGNKGDTDEEEESFIRPIKIISPPLIRSSEASKEGSVR